jgi:hypothetical protein
MRAIGPVLLSIAIVALQLTEADAKRRSSAQGSQAAGASRSWCAVHPRHGSENCGYTSFDQCWATTSNGAPNTERESWPSTPPSAGKPICDARKSTSVKPSLFAKTRNETPKGAPDEPDSEKSKSSSVAVAEMGACELIHTA